MCHILIARRSGDLERIGVSLDSDLLADFDKLIAQQGYQSRSEALRDLVNDDEIDREAFDRILNREEGSP